MNSVTASPSPAQAAPTASAPYPSAVTSPSGQSYAGGNRNEKIEKSFTPLVKQFLQYLKLEKHFSEYTVKSYGADLIQFGQYLAGEIGQAGNFDFRGEFFIRGWTNSGIYLHAPEHGRNMWCGMKINIFHMVDAKPAPESMGSIFPIAAPLKVNVKNKGEWNTFRIQMDWPRLRAWRPRPPGETARWRLDRVLENDEQTALAYVIAATVALAAIGWLRSI